MSNPQKSKGTNWERDVVVYLNSNGVQAYRPAQSGWKDVGDVNGVSPFVIQAKNWKDYVSAMREGLDGALTQARNAGERWGVAVVKRARRPVGEAYVIMRLEDFTEMLKELRSE